MIVAVGVALVLGVAVGYGIFRFVEHRRARTDPAPQAQVPLADGESDVSGSLREAVEHLEIGVLVVDGVGQVGYRNAAARSFRGTHVGVLLDDHVADVVADSRRAGTAVAVVELHGPPKLWLEISAHSVPSGGAVVSIRDVSERVRTDNMRSDFVTNISHELKTPVGAVAVLAEALIDELDPAVVTRLSDHLVEEAHRAVRTIDDLLKLSEIESTRPGDQVVDLAAVVESAVARGRVVDGGRGVEITPLDMPEGLQLRGDERQLVSAVGNLVENAVKYSHAGDVVQVRVRVDDSAIEVMVADQGIGIPTRDLDRVFERFYRVDRARSRETGGTGLGLAIVRHVATNHGGEVLVSSQEGEGSTFVLRLPATRLVAPGNPARSKMHEEQQHRE
ncbi:MAG TPA: ATP-binding protein [Ilumatobacteraceae bacterium]|jgi:two-component system sensor histidine kinase SenX3|nr:ATP-binding protein [Ilumatobacteraceae bacterium]